MKSWVRSCPRLGLALMVGLAPQLGAQPSDDGVAAALMAVLSQPFQGEPILYEVLRFRQVPEAVFLVGEGFGQDPEVVRVHVNTRPVPASGVLLHSDACLVLVDCPCTVGGRPQSYNEFRVAIKGRYSEPLVGSWPVHFADLTEALMGLSPDSPVLQYGVMMHKAFDSSLEASPGLADPSPGSQEPGGFGEQDWP